jgi:hypothetical protein
MNFKKDKTMKKFIFVIVFAMISGSALQALKFEVNGISYNVISADPPRVEVIAKATKYLGDVNIPCEVTYSNETYAVTGIADMAFFWCSGLINVRIPHTVTQIGCAAFWCCTALESITCCALTPPTLESDVFHMVPENIFLYVPSQSVDLYAQSPYWKDFLITGVTFLETEEKEMPDVLVYADPATGWIHISVPDNFRNYLFEMYDPTGRNVYYAKQDGSFSLSAHALSSGMYIYRISGKEIIQSGKFLNP